jgi:hypothetical protein
LKRQLTTPVERARSAQIQQGIHVTAKTANRGDGTSKRSRMLLGGGGGGGTGDIAFGSSNFRDTILGEATEIAVRTR